MRMLLDPESVTRGLRRVAGEIVERQGGVEDLVLVGIRRGGIAVARELLRWIRELEKRDVPFGTVSWGRFGSVRRMARRCSSIS